MTSSVFQVILFIFVFLSGFAGLLYEVVWSRLFGLIFGNTTLAISSVLSAFMLGLAGGSLLIGRLADRLRDLLRAYSLLELTIALGSALLIILLRPIDVFYAHLFQSLGSSSLIFHLIRFVVALVVMLPPTIAMGGTIPLLIRLVARDQQRLGMGIGMLYGINTLGATLGAFLTGFVLLRVIGVTPAISIGISLNLLVAIAAYGLSRVYGFEPAAEKIRTAQQTSERDGKTRVILVVMAVAGFTALAYEVLWSRVLVFVFTNSVYAFAIILTTFLTGIGLGSFVGGRLVDRVRDAQRTLGWIELALTGGALLAAVLLVNLSGIHDSLFRLGPRTTWWSWNGIRFLEAFLLMFPATFCMGMAFPVAGKLVIHETERSGSGLGTLYFWNTIGGALGSFLTTMLLIRVFGTSASLLAIVLVNLGLALYLLSRGFRQTVTWQYGPVGLATIAVILALVFTPRTLFTTTYSHVEQDFPLIDYREGLEGTVTVHVSPADAVEQVKRLDVDGLNVAGTSFMLQTLQTLQGHLPMLLHGQPKRVMQIGFGTGQTSRAVLHYPVQDFEVIEISDDVLEMAGEHFQEQNRNVLANPRLKTSILDGKNYVRYVDQTYDVIMNDANYAVATASASLFTRDHFETARRKLAPRGLFSTWMTTDLDPEDFRIVLQTFISVFPHASLWLAPNCINKQVVLVGSVQPLKMDLAVFDAIWDDPAIRAELESINIRSTFDLVNCLVLDATGIQAFAKGAAVNTDRNPILEFSTRAVRARDICAYQNLGRILMHRPDITRILVNLPTNDDERQLFLTRLGQNQDAGKLLLKGMLAAYEGRTFQALKTLMEASRMIPESRLAARFFTSTDQVTQKLMLDLARQPDDLEAALRLARHHITLDRIDEALQTLRVVGRRYASHPLVQYEMARCYLAQSNIDSARIYFEATVSAQPELAEGWYYLGEIARQQADWETAQRYLERALQIDGRIFAALNALGAIYEQKNDYQAAIDYYNRSLAIMAYQPIVVIRLGASRLRNGEPAAALTELQRAIAMGEKEAPVLFNLGNAYYLQKDFTRAIRYFQLAAARDSTNPEIYYNLGNAQASLSNFRAAIPAYQEALSLDRDEPDYFNNLAMTYSALGEYDQALAVINEGLKLHGQSELLRENAARIRSEKEKRP
ncbi:MAG: fused MFS/spermidine synthase [Fidelibacterota bacterium]|nr:MAG: fused MFS/spermidine synthase [Candidatus Neomarinimicrobiota bacterium]